MTGSTAQEHKWHQVHTPCVSLAQHTHRFCVELWRIVVDVGDGDESRRGVGKAKVQAALHVCGLHD